MKRLIHNVYKETVALADVPGELKVALRTNERVPAFLQRLEHEIMRLPLAQQTEANIRLLTSDLTRVFLRNIDKAAKSRLVSDAARTALQRQADKVKRFKEAADTGIITEEVLEDG